MNILGLGILALLLLEFGLRILSEILNLRSSQAEAEVPDGFKEFYDEVHYRRSQAYLVMRTRFGWCYATTLFAVTIAFWFSGGFGYLDDRLRFWHLHPVLAGMLFIGVLALLRGAVALPFGIYAAFVIEKRFGFNTASWKTFVADRVKMAALSVFLGGPLLAMVLALFEYVNRFAWLYCWVGAAGFMLCIQFVAPRWILPLFNAYSPLTNGDLRSAILSYARSVGFPLENIFIMDGSRRTTKSNAFFTGFGRHRRAVLFDTLVAAHTQPELVAIIAHEMAHYKKHHILWSLGLNILHTGFLLFLLSIVVSSRPLFDAFFLERASVYGGMALLALLYSPFDLVWGILLRLLSRRQEGEADRFAVATTGDGRALADALKKLSAHNLANLTPHRLYVMLRYSHPPLLERIEAIETMDSIIRASGSAPPGSGNRLSRRT
jgi:STE24 endopeptidase